MNKMGAVEVKAGGFRFGLDFITHCPYIFSRISCLSAVGGGGVSVRVVPGGHGDDDIDHLIQ